MARMEQWWKKSLYIIKVFLIQAVFSYLVFIICEPIMEDGGFIDFLMSILYGIGVFCFVFGVLFLINSIMLLYKRKIISILFHQQKPTVWFIIICFGIQFYIFAFYNYLIMRISS